MGKSLLETFAWWMDERFAIPGTKVRVGWDPIIDLIPGIGDGLSTLLQAAVVLITAFQYPELPRALIVRMLVNVLVDAGISAVPFLGNVGDVFFRANSMNAKLLRGALEKRERGKSVSTVRHTLFLLGLALGVLFLAAAIIAGSFVILRWLWNFT